MIKRHTLNVISRNKSNKSIFIVNRYFGIITEEILDRKLLLKKITYYQCELYLSETIPLLLEN